MHFRRVIMSVTVAELKNYPQYAIVQRKNGLTQIIMEKRVPIR
jgi:hypothetical protein